MTSIAKQNLSAKIAVATVLMWICLMASGGPLLYALYRIVASSHEPEGGFKGMAIMFTLFTWGIVLLFPLMGFAYALGWRRSLHEQLHKLESEEPNDDTYPASPTDGGIPLRSDSGRPCPAANDPLRWPARQ
jgi:hypothetical protein